MTFHINIANNILITLNKVPHSIAISNLNLRNFIRLIVNKSLIKRWSWGLELNILMKWLIIPLKLELFLCLF